MKILYTIPSILVCLFCTTVFSQQVTINDTFTPQQLIENNLIQGCVETSNIASEVNGTVNGFASFGYFEKGSSNFPFENGIVLSTGRAISGGNGQNNTVLNEGQPNWETDPDLEAALGISNTLNATSIEFDFVSISNQIQFNYILASEEYFQNFPCEYSDGFAFLIKEAGTSDPYTNIAVIPGTSIPVNTNTIHAAIVGYCPAANGEYFQGYNVGDTNYNGRTKVMSATATITPNITYKIKLIIADQTDKNYDSAVFIEGNSFNASVNLGDDITTCSDSLTLNGDIQNPAATYSWYFNGALVPNASQPTLTVSQSGLYTIQVAIPLAGTTCTIEDEVQISLSSTQTAAPIADYELCDDPSLDGIETFDLSTLNNEVLASVPASNYNISYHYSAMNALNNSNAIINPIQNSTNNQTIYIRIEDTINGCLAYSSFKLVVNPPPTITSPTMLLVCDDAVADGFTQIDFTQSNDEITNGQPDLIVTYHLTQASADAGVNAIPMPFVNTSPNGQVFVRVQNALTGCYTTTSLSYTVMSSPAIAYEDIYVDACDQDHDGMATFDLNTVITDVTQNTAGMNITFHETLLDAESGSNPIADPANYNNIVIFEQILFIRVEDTATGCASVRSFEIHSNLLLTGTEIQDFSFCDDGNDGIEYFDLNDMATEIINGLEDVSIIFYVSETDRDNQMNALNPNTPYGPTEFPTFLYLTLNSPTCSEVSEIELILNSIAEFPNAGPVSYCDNDSDGFASIDLHSFDSLVTGGLTGYNVTYYATEADAEAHINPLPNFYTNTASSITIYPKISDVNTNCGDVNPFTINIMPAPLTTAPEDIIVCDDDQDGMAMINLTQVYSQLVGDTSNISFAFYNTNGDLQNDINEFTNVSNYVTNSKRIHVKVTNTQTGCWSKERFEIIVNTVPNIPEITDYKYCEEASDNIGEFTFSHKDQEILNGQIGKKTFYYRTQSDADNRVNAINKNATYQNISNPQTIFVRVENISDIDCYDTSSFIIKIGTNPLFNEPADIFLCDDISNDASEVFDLGEKISEITEGINESLTVTFHTSPAEAESGLNPLPLQYANTVNPQQIYTRIDNGNVCVSKPSFTLNVVQVAQANQPSPLEMCDTDYDGIVTFDLTLAEIEILDVRQDNIEISYFTNLIDLDQETNPITNTSAFTNQTNPQFVYVRVTNLISDCYLAIPLELIVNLPPAINQFGSVSVCENENNYFDLSTVNPLLVANTANMNITYHTTVDDATTGTNSLSTDYTYTSNNTTIHARVVNATTGCDMTYAFQLVVKPLPVANMPNDLANCDDDFDAILEFDLTVQNAAILGGQNPANFTVTYYDALTKAFSGTDPIPYNYVAFDGELIYVRVENNLTGCFETTQFNIIIHPRPVVDIPDQVICLENLPLRVSAETNNPTDTYLWSNGQTTPDIEITDIGMYSVTVTSEWYCVSTEEFNVIESEQANIEIVDTIDFSDPNNITITISGIGNYLYQIDNETPQESNVFENVTMGYHIITVIDINGCNDASKRVLVLDFPKFMTPNDDGYYDTWHIIGIETIPETVIYIYDRYGKQLTFLTAGSRGWDGTFNGHNLPSNDYWFVANVKGGGYDFQAKGHFTLKR